MIKPDYPIDTKEKDLLNRSAMAKHVAKLVNDFSSHESFVVGIEGEWGSGKTSFINLVKEEVDFEKAEILFFNPWNFSSQDELIEDFFNSLFSILEKNTKDSKIKEVFKKYKRKLKKFELAPELYGIKLFSVQSKDFTSLDSLRKDVENELVKMSKKILIIIDDIDRLDTVETLAIFKLVKITANFPNCIFFLAYDRKRVTQRIDKVTNDSGEDYLKKIIQTTFRLPNISTKQIEQMVFTDIDLTLKDLFGGIDFTQEEKARWNKITYNGFAQFFSNIRDLKRYISSLRLNLSVVGKHELNIIDFLTLEAIRVFAPNLYDQIPRYKWIFVKGAYGLIFNYHRKDEWPKIFQKLIDDTIGDHPQKDEIVRILKELFPETNFQSNYGSDWEEIWRGNKQVCSNEKFDTYFQLSVSTDELSEEEFTLIQGEISSKNEAEILSFIKQLQKSKKISDFLRKNHDHFDNIYVFDSTYFDKLTMGLALFSNDLTTVDEDYFDFGTVQRQFQRMIWRICQKKNQADKYTYLKLLLDKQEHLYQRVHLIRVLISEKDGTENNLKEMKLTLDRIVSELLPVLQIAVDTDKLKYEKRGGAIMWGYVDWGKETEIKKYLSKMSKDQEDIFTLLEWFKVKNNSSSRGEYSSIDKTSLWKFVDQSDFEKTLANITRSLSQEEENLKELFESKDKFFA